MRKQYLAITTAVLAATLLAGCSGGGSGDGGGDASGGSGSTKASPTQAAPAQTKQEACDLVENELRSYIESQSTAAADATTTEDRAKVVDGLTSRLDDVVPKVTNDEVKQDFQAFSSAAKDYVSTIKESGSQTSDKAVAAQEKVQGTLKDLSADCPS